MNEGNAKQPDNVAQSANAAKPDLACGAPGDCRKIREALEELLRGELCEAESAPLRHHIQHCSDCQNEEKTLDRLTDAVKRACREDKAPLSLREAIARGIQNDGHFGAPQ